MRVAAFQRHPWRLVAVDVSGSLDTSSFLLRFPLLGLLSFPLCLFLFEGCLRNGDHGAEHPVEGLELVGAVALSDGLGTEGDWAGRMRGFHRSYGNAVHLVLRERKHQANLQLPRLCGTFEFDVAPTMEPG